MASISQNSFVGGEWAPSLYGRYDLAKYPTAVRVMKNFFPHPHGGASNRGGTRFVAEVKDQARRPRLLNFQFSTVQSYVLEFGHLYMRVIKDAGLVVETSGAGTDIVNSAVYKWTPSGFGTNEYYLELLAGGDPGLADPLFVFEDVGGAGTILGLGTLGTLVAGEYAFGDNDALGFDTIYVRLTDNVDPDTKANGYLEAGYVFELTTPYTEADLATLKFAQSADVMYFTHPSYPVKKLSRLAHDNWTLTDVVFMASIGTPGGLSFSGDTQSKYRVTAVSADGEESLPSVTQIMNNGNTFTWTPVTDAEYYNIYKDENSSDTFGWVAQANSATFTVPTAGLIADYSRVPPTSNVPFGASGDNPGCCAFFEQRLCFARTDNQPQTIWGSVVGAFENMNRSFPLRDDDSYEFEINSQQVNEARWLVPLNVLLIGTSGGEFKMAAGGVGDAVTPSSVNMKQQSSWGVSHVPPIVIGNTVLFIDGSLKRARDLLFSTEQGGYAGSDLSVLANHLFRNYEIKEWAYQQHPDSIIWCVRNDGALLGLTYYREHEVIGWHRHDTDGVFESVAAITTNAGVSELYCVVKRNINGVEKRYIERFEDRLPFNSEYSIDVEDAWFVDCGLNVDGRNEDAAFLLGLSGGVTWAAGESVTLTASGFSPFSLASVGRYYRLSAGGVNIVMEVTGYTSPTVVTAKAINREIPLELQSGTVSKWALMVTDITGLEHLEGKDVAILADGNVITGLTVTAGEITLPNPAAIAVIGLPYVSDIETLDFETQTPDGTVQDKLREINSVLFRLENTRALSVGPSEDRLTDLAFRESEYYGEPIQLFTGDKEAFTEAGEPREGRIFIRNTYPVPVTILALIVRMDYGEP